MFNILVVVFYLPEELYFSFTAGATLRKLQKSFALPSP